jgi:hypothetical protein
MAEMAEVADVVHHLLKQAKEYGKCGDRETQQAGREHDSGLFGPADQEKYKSRQRGARADENGKIEK